MMMMMMMMMILLLSLTFFWKKNTDAYRLKMWRSHSDFKINFMHLNAPSRSYNWPNRDICWALSSRNLLSWRQYHISKDDLFIENILPPWIFLFFILPEFFSKSPQTKYNIISHDWEKFNNQSFLEDFENINWNQVLQLRYYATLNFWKTKFVWIVQNHF